MEPSDKVFYWFFIHSWDSNFIRKMDRTYPILKKWPLGGSNGGFVAMISFVENYFLVSW